MKRDGQRTVAAVSRSSGIQAGGAIGRAPPAGSFGLPQARPSSTRALYSIAEAGNRLVWGNRFILHVFGDYIDHRRRHAVLLRHVVRDAEHGLVGGDGLLERGSGAALPVRPTAGGEVHIGAHGY